MAYAIIPAAGKGIRMGYPYNKVFIELKGKPIIAHTLAAFEENDIIEGVVLVTYADDIKRMVDIVREYGFSKVINVVRGGDTRQESVSNGMDFLFERDIDNDDVVCIHNGANPAVSQEDINKAIDAALVHGASVVAHPVKDTVKIVDNDGMVKQTLDRTALWAMQTPQCMRCDVARAVYTDPDLLREACTDDVHLAEKAGFKVKVLRSSPQNIKVTIKEDLDLIGGWL